MVVYGFSLSNPSTQGLENPMEKGATEEYKQMGYKAPRIEIPLHQHDQSSYSLLSNERNTGR